MALGGRLGPAKGGDALFALSLPMQGLWWLRETFCDAIAAFNPLNWFTKFAVVRRLDEALAPVEGKPDYRALADKRAFKQLDKTFTDDL